MAGVAKPQPHGPALAASVGRLHGAPAPVARRRRLSILGGGIEAAPVQVAQAIVADGAIPHAVGAALGAAAGGRHGAETALARRRRL